MPSMSECGNQTRDKQQQCKHCSRGRRLPTYTCNKYKGYVPIKAFYSPHLTSTLIGETCIMGETKHQRAQYKSQIIHKHLHESNFTLICEHQHTRRKYIIIDGVLIDDQCFTRPSVIMDLEGQHAMAIADDSMGIA